MATCKLSHINSLSFTTMHFQFQNVVHACGFVIPYVQQIVIFLLLSTSKTLYTPVCLFFPIQHLTTEYNLSQLGYLTLEYNLSQLGHLTLEYNYSVLQQQCPGKGQFTKERETLLRSKVSYREQVTVRVPINLLFVYETIIWGIQ